MCGRFPLKDDIMARLSLGSVPWELYRNPMQKVPFWDPSSLDSVLAAPLWSENEKYQGESP